MHISATTFPFIVFRSTGVSAMKDRKFQATGDLTIRGVTREVTLDIEYGGAMVDPSGQQRVGFSATTTISRKAFGITFNQMLDTGGLALGDKLEIQIEVEAFEHEVSEVTLPNGERIAL